MNALTSAIKQHNNESSTKFVWNLDSKHQLVIFTIENTVNIFQNDYVKCKPFIKAQRGIYMYISQLSFPGTYLMANYSWKLFHLPFFHCAQEWKHVFEENC